MIKTFICVSCPTGCELTAEIENGRLKSVSGNTCKRGLEYAKNEIENPKRMLTTTVKTAGGGLLPVRTREPVPKALLLDCMAKINDVVLNRPVDMGDTVIPDILHTGVDVIAARPSVCP